MSQIAIGVTVGGAQPSSAQIPVTASSVAASLSNLVADAATLTAAVTALNNQATTCSTDEGTASTDTTTATTDVGTALSYISSVLATPDEYLNRLAQTATIGGTLTAGNVLSLVFTSSALTGSPITVSYTTIAGDTINSMATGLAAAVNANATLTGKYVKATASANVVTIDYGMAEDIVLTETVTSGGTETITLASVTSATPVATVTQIQTKVTQVQTDLTNIATALTTLSGAISLLQTDAGTVNTDASTVSSDATAAQSAVSGANVYIQTDTGVVSSASQLNAALINALAFAIASGIVTN